MGIVRYENSPKVSPENAVVCDYYKAERAHTMPRMHYHSFYEIYILISGKRKYFFRNKIIKLSPQDILIIKPNDPHKAIPIDDVPYERYVIYIDPSLFSQIEKYNKKTKEIFKKDVLHLDDSAFRRILNMIGCIEKEKKEKKEIYAYSIRNHIERISAVRNTWKQWIQDAQRRCAFGTKLRYVVKTTKIKTENRGLSSAFGLFYINCSQADDKRKSFI